MLKHPGKSPLMKAKSSCCGAEVNLNPDAETMQKKQAAARALGLPTDCIDYVGVKYSFFCQQCGKVCEMILFPIETKSASVA